ncbi:alpha-L-arabinofuranosidase [Xylariomycetidae sp. FL0641]|nr:alpha-L-arabinofuranosidase [Xylariomycetidae sp. FL0641]
MVSSAFVALAGLCTLSAAIPTNVTTVNISVKSDGGNATSGYQYGLLYEDINNSGDGGLYAELVHNRAFQSSEGFPSTLDYWYPVNGAKLSLKNLSEPLSEALPTSMNVAAGNQSEKVGFFNVGFWGMDVKVQKYTGSFWVKGEYEGHFTASLQSNITGEKFGEVEVKSQSKADEWVQHEFDLTPSKDAPNSNNTFAITFDTAGTKGSLDFNLISLFPPTFMERPNGLRTDLVEAIQGFHPTMFRFPGGNMLEGNANTSWWNWKDSLGPLKDRPGYAGVWEYPVTNGFGLYEMLQFGEDMGMELVLGVWGGMSLNGDLTPPDKLQPFIDSALEELEFVTGPEDSKWGSVRASMGHPEPFKLNFVEIGNEEYLQGEEQWNAYKEYRFPRFLEAINKAYPELQVISAGSYYDGYDNVPSSAAEDYHLYPTPDEMVGKFGLWDNMTIPTIVGEHAVVHPNGGMGFDGELAPYPWWGGSVGETVGLISYERNAKHIYGTLYAPIVRNMNRWQWSITMIQFAADPAMTTRSTDWYVWELMAGHIMTETLPATADFDPLYYVAGKNEETGGYIFKGAVYNSTGGVDVPVKLSFDGVDPGTTAELTVLTGPADPYAYNDPHVGNNVVKTTKHKIESDEEGSFHFKLPNLSVAVLDTGSTSKSRRAQVPENGS